MRCTLKVINIDNFHAVGSAKHPGIIPQSVHTIFANININRKLQYKPCLAKDVVKLSLETVQEELRIKNEILRTFRVCYLYALYCQDLFVLAYNIHFFPFSILNFQNMPSRIPVIICKLYKLLLLI